MTIIEVVYFNVQVDAWLNDWYGDFYNLIQPAMGAPNTVTFDEYVGKIWTVAAVLAVNIFVLVMNAFFNAHYLFRWRRAMSFYYMANWQRVRTSKALRSASRKTPRASRQSSRASASTSYPQS